jgi:hypothetical protein
LILLGAGAAQVSIIVPGPYLLFLSSALASVAYLGGGDGKKCAEVGYRTDGLHRVEVSEADAALFLPCTFWARSREMNCQLCRCCGIFGPSPRFRWAMHTAVCGGGRLQLQRPAAGRHSFNLMCPSEIAGRPGQRWDCWNVKCTLALPASASSAAHRQNTRFKRCHSKCLQEIRVRLLQHCYPVQGASNNCGRRNDRSCKDKVF